MLVLVVDDEKSLCDLVADILSEEYQVIKAYNGKEALKLAREHRPTVIISDVMMPEMTGLELVDVIRSDPDTCQIPVVLMSAASSPGQAVNASAFLKKPFEIDVLEKIVGHFIFSHHKEQPFDAKDNQHQPHEIIDFNNSFHQKDHQRSA